jgi:ribosomal protein S18 acetylase RimI-like enzyme
MVIEMDHPPPQPVRPEGVTVRTFAPGLDERAVFDTVQEAFKDVWSREPMKFERWVEWTKQANFDPTLWFLAVDGGEIVGVVLAEQELDTGHVVQVGVRRAWRRRGIGSALLLHAFREFNRRGERKVRLTVDAESPTGATRLYERAGMHASLHFARYRKVLRPESKLPLSSASA